MLIRFQLSKIKIKMPFKINISHKGKTYKLETESEVIVGKKIGEKIKGEDISNELNGYELQITGTSDISGIPGFKGLEGSGYHKRLLTYGSGMKDRRKGMRLRKTNRGEEISLKTSQVNTTIVKEGNKKFNTLIEKPKTEEAPKEEKKEETKEEKPEPKEEREKEQKPKTEEAQSKEPTPNTSPEKPTTDTNKEKPAETKEKTSKQ